MNAGMKDKIEFVSKVIGLVIVCSGIVSAIGLAYLIIFLGTDYNQLQHINSYNSFGSRELNNALYAMFQIERQFYIKLLILSLLPIPFGMYLMKSSNIFVRYCCPDEADESNAELFDPYFEEIAEEDEFNIGDYIDEDGTRYGKCPACNADLIKRKLEHGKHAGKYIISCSNFPQCKQVQPYKAVQTETEQPFRL
jgi:hypothetical protein